MSTRRRRKEEEESEEESEYSESGSEEDGTEYETGSDEYSDEEESEYSDEEENERTWRPRAEERMTDGSSARHSPNHSDGSKGSSSSRGHDNSKWNAPVTTEDSRDNRKADGLRDSKPAQPAVYTDSAVPVGRRRSSFVEMILGGGAVEHANITVTPMIDIHSYCNVVHVVDKDHVLCGCGDSTVRLYSLETGQLIRFFEGLSDRVLCATSVTRTVPELTTSAYDFARQKRDAQWAQEINMDINDYIIIAGSRDETFCAWNLVSGELLYQIEAHEGAVWSLAAVAYYESIDNLASKTKKSQYAPISKCIISAGADGLVKTWNLEDGDHLKTYRGHGGRVNSVAVLTDPASPYEYQVVSAGVGKKIHVWNLITAQTTFILDGHIDEVLSVAAIRTPNNGHYHAIDKLSNKAKQSGKYLTEVPRGSHDAENVVIITGGRDRRIWVWDYRGSKAIYTFRGHSDVVTVVSGFVSRAGQLIVVSGSDDCTLRLWSMSSCTCVSSQRCHDRSIRGLSTLNLLQSGAAAQSFSPVYKSTIIATGGWDKKIKAHHETVEEYTIGRRICSIM